MINFKSIVCQHNFTFERNIYGDEITSSNYNRSLYKCSKCGKIKMGKNLVLNKIEQYNELKDLGIQELYKIIVDGIYTDNLNEKKRAVSALLVLIRKLYKFKR